jgi:hypothetical protein
MLLLHAEVTSDVGVQVLASCRALDALIEPMQTTESAVLPQHSSDTLGCTLVTDHDESLEQVWLSVALMRP